MRTSHASRVRTLIAASALAVSVAVAGIAVGAPASAATAPSVTIYVPNLIQAGVPSPLVATVAGDPAQAAPTGSVTFSTGYGATLGTVALTPGTNGQSSATYQWTPPPAFSVPVLATYTPTGAASAAATSVTMWPEITTAAVPVALRFAPTLTAGPQVLDAVLGYNFGAGTAAFLVDGKGWTGSVPTTNGVASVTWQATPGIHTIEVQYSSYATNPRGYSLQTGSSTQIVNVLP